MGSALPTEKLEHNNYASSEYKMQQYLPRHGYLSYIDGANEVVPEPHTRTLCHVHRSSVTLSDLGTGNKQGDVVPSFLYEGSNVGLHQRRNNVEGGLEKSEEDFRRKYYSPQVAVKAGAQQYPPEGYVCDRLYHQDKRDLQYFGLPQRDGRRRRDGTNLPWRFSTKV